MNLQELLLRIASTYDRALDMQSEAQLLLRKSSETVLGPAVSANYVVKGSGGQSTPAFVPWIAVFNPDETDQAQHGMYVVYLFKADMTGVYLSLNHGVTELTSLHGRQKARMILANQATEIRAHMPALSPYLATIDLASRAGLPRDYEAGNIAALAYDTAALPSSAELVADLDELLRLYDNALDVRDALRIKAADKILTTKQALEIPPVEPEFKPKSSADYIQHFKEQHLVKSRSHEKVVRLYGEFLSDRGFVPNTKNVHPRDLTAERNHEHWLIEVKVVIKANGVAATREALAQLLMYREFLYPEGVDVHMLAVFSESVGELNVKLLEKYGIASAWKSGDAWAGSPKATAAGLVSKSDT
ncbi:hypothetical protein C3477_06755 [Mycobacterium kansasii]|uniref:MrcB family domain-containing protein n=1 Tax=Mycobacterium kansasii TaxID=1768 RepID=UPI000CDE1993|nr:DUF3578 domain-containing protein [Mycobacterium kansasii]POX90633.1 hypothetical protein C3B43_06485 [Mycobacterium kansasii]POY07659.1 hypothetical protein C3477_06755 [Mycobacterium kansasii]POY22664.1 hypothetical protein C3476_10460 [Mycobacterium kansasii]